jgi:poly-beta-1,6-N-acetyl-D-glucosamine N-deacetylase
VSRTRLIFRLLTLTGIPWLIRERVQRGRVTILLFHDPDQERADAHFAALAARYNFISLTDYLAARQAGTMCRLPPKPLIVTFDDGHKGNYELLPLLKKYCIPAVIFLCSSIVGTSRHFWFQHGITQAESQRLKTMDDSRRLAALQGADFVEDRDYGTRQALSVAEIEEMAGTVDFQSHTRFHPVLPRCAVERAQEEIAGSKQDLERRLALEVYALSYPNGDYGEREIAMAGDAGYTCAITVDPGFNSLTTDLFALKRICVEDDADLSTLLAKACGLPAYVKKLLGRQGYGYQQSSPSGDAQTS